MNTEFDEVETPLEKEATAAEARLHELETRLAAETADRDEAERAAATAVLAGDREAAEAQEWRAKKIGKSCAVLNKRLKGARKDLTRIQKAASNAMRGGRSTVGDEDDQQAVPPNLPIEGVRWTKTGRPLLELRIDSVWYTFPTVAMTNRGLFRQRWLELTGAFPTLPRGKDADKVWEKYVEELYAQAQVHVPPPDATPEGLLKEDVQQALESLTFGSTRAELDARRALRRDGEILFKMTALRPLISEPSPEPLKLYAALRDLGAKSELRRIDGEVVRVWVLAQSHPISVAATAPTAVPVIPASVPDTAVPIEPAEPAMPPVPSDNPDFSEVA